ncbi:fimbrial protein FaeI [Escherichia coli]|uniref:F4 family fimbrial subunit n=1 Tax=Escherichia coli TaxID=562 RepID=UPI0010CAF42C|nr:fimbrial protein [Escherichia coli]GDA14477.1 fimbrial protein FaeI [Escherichia coli]
MKKTLIALAVAASAAVSGSAMAWQDGDFSGSVDIGGNITQEQPTWQWKIGNMSADAINLRLADATQSGSDNVWSNIGEKAYPILMGKTKFEYSNVSSGMSPVITYSGDGFNIKYPADSSPIITLTATGKTDTSKVGTLQFKMNMFALSDMLWKGDGVTTQDKDTYQMIADTAKTYGNGYFQNAGYVKTMTTDDVKNELTRILGADMITISPSAVPTQSYTGPAIFDRTDAFNIEGVYGSEYVANSGTLTFPQNATPTDWKATLKVTVSYQ